MTASLFPYSDIDAEHKVIAATQRWLEKAVIGLNLCPFAKAVYVKQQIRYAVSAAKTADELLAELEQELNILTQADPASIDTTLLIHPCVMSGFIDFHFFLDEANAMLKNLDLVGIIQIAHFHPNFEFAGSPPDDITHYTNRAPFPILHLLRETSIDRAVAAFPDAATIFAKNIATMQQLGLDGWKKLFADPT